MQIKRYCLTIWLLLWLAAPALAGNDGKAKPIVAVDAIGITVSDMERALAFYTGVLPFEKVSDDELWGTPYEYLHGVFGLRVRIVRLRLGDEFVELTDFLAPEGRPLPEDSRSNDHWFQHIAIVVSDMDRAYAHLRRQQVTHASTGPQQIPAWNQAAAGIRAFYFKDPDGHNLEIIYFPPGKGDPRWQQGTSRLFLGIDHTAIVVGDSEASLAFYRDLLGMLVAGESENYGIEQEHLNNVFGARLRITSVRASRGPAIEFLEYLAPSDGRPFPIDARANDLLHWHTTLVTDNAEGLVARLRAGRARFVSPLVVAMPDAHLGFSQGMLVRDPTGHALRIVQK